MKNKQHFDFRKLCFVLALILTQCLYAQNKTITGTVTDSTQEPLIGVNVTVKGNSSVGTITDMDGKYTLPVPSGKITLVFSYIGYMAQEIVVGSQSTIDVVLLDDAQALEEVVVVGYGTMKKSDLTGSVSSISSDRFKVGTDLSPQQLMQGAFSGVNISQNSGKPGGSNTIRVRGGTSISASNDPLYVIDGVPINSSAGVSSSHIASNGSNTDFFDQESVNPLASINPNDIESINNPERCFCYCHLWFPWC